MTNTSGRSTAGQHVFDDRIEILKQRALESTRRTERELELRNKRWRKSWFYRLFLKRR